MHNLSRYFTKSQHTGRYVTNTAHFPENTVYSETSYQQKYEAKMQEIGESAHIFFKQLIATDPMGWKRSVGKILGLVQKYGKEKVEKAIKRAIAFKAYHWRVVTNICENNLEDAEIERGLIQGIVEDPTSSSQTRLGGAGGAETKQEREQGQTEGLKTAGASGEHTGGNEATNGHKSLDRDLSYYAIYEREEVS